MAHPFGRLSIPARAVRLIAVCLLLLSAATARANTVLYNYVGSAGSGPANVMVRFTLLENVIELAIWNFQADIKGDISTLNSVEFVLSGEQTTAAITGRSGMEVEFPSKGTNITPKILPGGTTAFTNDTNPGWHLTSATFFRNTGIKLTALDGNNDHTIVGPAGPGGVFTNINGSMPTHNPFLYTPDLSTPVRFNLSVPGVTESDTVTGVRFTFGTATAAEYGGTYVTPEPGTWCLVGTGLLGALIWRRKRSKSQS